MQSASHSIRASGAHDIYCWAKSCVFTWFRAAGAASHAQAALDASARDALEEALMRAEAAQEEARFMLFLAH